ncbi:Perforin-1 [Dissostichus eleginoides]|uniref:Perforin-1 n=1 Tax=Dissostichus eleginoides TaxID=100907 RepID=A0AAD9BKB4_DISEL|nr:Perforin-1 [Dissostichus eleginoides]
MASCSPLLLLVLCTLTVAEAQLKLFNLRARRLNSGILGTPDAYVEVFCGSANLGETSVRRNNRNPWEEDFTYLDSQENDMMRLEVHDQDIGFDDLLGVCQRQIKLGTHEHECFLKKGGTLRYTYTLS